MWDRFFLLFVSPSSSFSFFLSFFPSFLLFQLRCSCTAEWYVIPSLLLSFFLFLCFNSSSHPVFSVLALWQRCWICAGVYFTGHYQDPLSPCFNSQFIPVDSISELSEYRALGAEQFGALRESRDRGIQLQLADIEAARVSVRAAPSTSTSAASPQPTRADFWRTFNRDILHDSSH